MNNTEITLFVATWNASTSAAEVASAVNRTPAACRTIASRLRKRGHELKRMPHPWDDPAIRAEAGRIGGLKAKELGLVPICYGNKFSRLCGNSELAREIGAKGGLRTVEHMRKIGKMSTGRFKPGNKVGQLGYLMRAVERIVTKASVQYA